MDEARGHEMHALVRRLFPIGRSLSGDGVRETLGILGEVIPGLRVHQVASGTKCFDWTVPKEWNVREAYLLTPDGERIADFRDHNLHLVGYSVPQDREIELEELQQYLFSLPEQPDAIPYVTSYYRESWGFCLRHSERLRLRPGTYRVRVDSTLEPGHLTYADLLLPGEGPEEVLLSTYVCHPSMANNELSGPVVAAYLARWLMSLPRRRYTYRFVFVPETIGSIVYLSHHLEHLRRHVRAGFVVTCVGDDRAWSFLPSRSGDTLADRAARLALRTVAGDFKAYSFLDRGSDERQYCSPLVDLPVVSIMRSKYGCYPEYHTSQDDLSLVTPSGLLGGFEAHRTALRILEANDHYAVTVPCEPHLGPRGLYPTLSTRDSGRTVRSMMNFIAYADGRADLIDHCRLADLDFNQLQAFLPDLLRAGLVERRGPPA